MITAVCYVRIIGVFFFVLEKVKKLVYLGLEYYSARVLHTNDNVLPLEGIGT